MGKASNDIVLNDGGATIDTTKYAAHTPIKLKMHETIAPDLTAGNVTKNSRFKGRTPKLAAWRSKSKS
jgi:hypothetical protein